MAKRRTLEQDMAKLKTKIQESSAQGDSSKEQSETRSLRKRLKRAQRKARRIKQKRPVFRKRRQPRAHKRGSETIWRKTVCETVKTTSTMNFPIKQNLSL